MALARSGHNSAPSWSAAVPSAEGGLSGQVDGSLSAAPLMPSAAFSSAPTDWSAVVPAAFKLAAQELRRAQVEGLLKAAPMMPSAAFSSAQNKEAITQNEVSAGAAAAACGSAQDNSCNWEIRHPLTTGKFGIRL